MVPSFVQISTLPGIVLLGYVPEARLIICLAWSEVNPAFLASIITVSAPCFNPCCNLVIPVLTLGFSKS